MVVSLYLKIVLNGGPCLKEYPLILIPTVIHMLYGINILLGILRQGDLKKQKAANSRGKS
jgi:hypothetical protein